jgi:BclB C-terminal domain-containing protein
VNGNIIDLNNSNSAAINFAFSLPREAVITSMSAFFNQLTGPDLDRGHMAIRAQLFSAPPETNLFTAVPRAEVILTAADDDQERNDDDNRNHHNRNLSGLTTGLDIRIRAETRLLMAFLIETNGSSQCVTGYASAGLNLL